MDCALFYFASIFTVTQSSSHGPSVADAVAFGVPQLLDALWQGFAQALDIQVVIYVLDYSSEPRAIVFNRLLPWLRRPRCHLPEAGPRRDRGGTALTEGKWGGSKGGTGGGTEAGPRRDRVDRRKMGRDRLTPFGL